MKIIKVVKNPILTKFEEPKFVFSWILNLQIQRLKTLNFGLNCGNSSFEKGDEITDNFQNGLSNSNQMIIYNFNQIAGTLEVLLNAKGLIISLFKYITLK